MATWNEAPQWSNGKKNRKIIKQKFLQKSFWQSQVSAAECGFQLCLPEKLSVSPILVLSIFLFPYQYLCLSVHQLSNILFFSGQRPPLPSLPAGSLSAPWPVRHPSRERARGLCAAGSGMNSQGRQSCAPAYVFLRLRVSFQHPRCTEA